jgi:hypothetical protein
VSAPLVRRQGGVRLKASYLGSTAIEGLSGNPSGGFCCGPPPVAVSERLGFSPSTMRWTRIGRAMFLTCLLAHIFKREGELIPHLVPHYPADTDPAGLGEGFEPGPAD